ncbi:hypothetical protein [Streptomyces turgidiscabies]|uniref:Uncharacterized protein n=1 Tax=Streptomyces turgidiscabies TaxID=85558 RepID=A0ABU0REX6_9ACTN|nr:hypothetical protein [Streptomyces turgidiscabies]MDQ0930253.1 hypothetical protein [Streptomyces turgidiscabies]
MGATEEAGKIHQLAEDIRKLIDQPIEIAADAQVKKDERWQGPTAEKVRGELKVRKTRLGSMADDLERAATQRGKEDRGGGS